MDLPSLEITPFSSPGGFQEDSEVGWSCLWIVWDKDRQRIFTRKRQRSGVGADVPFRTSAHGAYGLCLLRLRPHTYALYDANIRIISTLLLSFDARKLFRPQQTSLSLPMSGLSTTPTSTRWDASPQDHPAAHGEAGSRRPRARSSSVRS